MSPKHVVLVTNELRGFRPVGGLGTATTFLAVALARTGHRVEVRYFGRSGEPIDPYWAGVYERAGVRLLEIQDRTETVTPSNFARMAAVEAALRTDTPDVVIVQDIGAPAYTAMRLRQLGLAFENTLFVVYCHGTRRWVTDMSRKLRVKNVPDLLTDSALERASLELADAVVSPSAYLVEWMRDQGWRLPERTLVIPYMTQTGAMASPPRPARVDGHRRIERLTFFGRLEEKKGLKPFAAGLNALDSELLGSVELEFLGKPTPAWPPERVEALLSESARRSLRGISFETNLDQHQALGRLSRPGTLAVMPSLGDNSPNTVYECLERGIPFIAGRVGGIAELITAADRDRVLFEPTAAGVEAALRALLASGRVPAPARAAFDDAASLARWQEVLALPAARRPPPAEQPAVDVVVLEAEGERSPEPLLEALEQQTYRELRVIMAATRREGLERAEAEWLIFLDEEDLPERELLATLVRAQQASGADVVSSALRLLADGQGERLHYFAGEPDGLGVLANGYGTVALLRRSLIGELSSSWPVEGDLDWLLLARLAAAGARIVSVPVALVSRRSLPGSLERHPSDALLVLEELERALPDRLHSLARLAAGLAAQQAERAAAPPPGLARRASHVLRSEGLRALARRAEHRLRRRSC